MFKKLIDVVPGDRVVGIGCVEAVSTDRYDVTTLVARNLGLPTNVRDTDEALTTYVWKASQLVDVGDTDGS